MGAYRDTKGDKGNTGKPFWRLTRYGESFWNKVIQIPKNPVSILVSSRVHPPWKPTPAPPGWLASRGQGHRLTRATLAAANLARDSADPDQRASGCGGLLSQLPHKSGGRWEAATGTPPAPPHMHTSTFLVFIDTQITHTIPPVQTSPAALETSCFSASRTTQEPKRGLFPPLLSVGVLVPGTSTPSRHPF